MAFVLKFGYHLSSVSLGLFLHPYQTVQLTVRQRLPLAIIFLPSLIWLVAMLLLRFFEYILFFLMPYIGVWWFLFVFGTIFLALWQLLLAYLYLRFSSILKS